MRENMSKADRLIRAFLVAPAAIIAGILIGAGSIGGIVLFAIAGVMIATAAVAYCPLYALIHTGTRTRSVPHA